MFIACQHQLCSASIHVHWFFWGQTAMSFLPISLLARSSKLQTCPLVPSPALSSGAFGRGWSELPKKTTPCSGPGVPPTPAAAKTQNSQKKKNKGEWKGSPAKDKWTEEGIQTIEFPCGNPFWNKTVVVVIQGYAWGRITQSYARTHIYRCQKIDDIWIRSVVW